MKDQNCLLLPLLAACTLALPYAAYGQNERRPANCEVLPAEEKDACEMKVKAMKFCHPEKEQDRFVACVNSVIKHPPNRLMTPASASKAQ